MKAVIKREITFTPEEVEAAKNISTICDQICRIMDNNCQHCPLNDICGGMEEFLQDMISGCISTKIEE